MSEIKENAQNLSHESSLLGAFDDDDFDALWKSTIASEPEKDGEMTTPASKLGGMDVSWDGLNDSDPGWDNLMNSMDETLGGSTNSGDADAKDGPSADIPIHIEEIDAQPKSEDAQPKSEDAQPKSEDAQPKFEDAQPKSEDAQPKSEDAQPKSEDAQPKSEDAQAESEDKNVAVSDKKESFEKEAGVSQLMLELSDDLGKPEQEKSKAEGKSKKKKKTPKAPRETDDAIKNASVAAIDQAPENESSPKPEEIAEAEDESSSKSEEMADGEPEADDPGEVTLTERARMGRIQPENEVVTVEHEIGHDKQYPDELCEPQVLPSQNTLKHLLLAAVLLLSIALVIGIIFVSLKANELHVNYAQQAAFQIGNTSFEHYYVTQNGLFKAACSDGRGIVLNEEDHLISEFWPGVTGCTDLRIAENGSRVWFVDATGTLFEVNLETEQGFNPRRLAILEGFLNAGFEVRGNRIYWFANSDATKPSPVLRQQKILSSDFEDTPLPEDSMICQGFHNGNYAYISGNAIHMIQEGNKISAPLDAPKLGCPIQFALHCAYDGIDKWSALCVNSIHQGTGSQAQTPIQYQNTSLRSGAAHFNLIRHHDGAELITPLEWVRVDSRGNDKVIKFKQKLGQSFDLIYTGKTETPIHGVSNGRFTDISADGQVVESVNGSTLAKIGSAFVSDRNIVVSFYADTANNNNARYVIWDAYNGSMLASQAFESPMQGVNVSTRGAAGFVVTGTEKQQQLNWVVWPSGSVLGTVNLPSPVVNADWTMDDKYVLIELASGVKQLYEHNIDKFELKREYPANVVISLARNRLLWRFENQQLRMERIEDGAFSVVDAKLSNVLAEAQIQNITVHPATDDVFFWGKSGIWRYNAATKHINQVTNAPVTWVVPDNAGKWIASSVGFVDLASLVTKPLPQDMGSLPVHWVGLNGFLFSGDSRTLLNIDKDVLYDARNASALRFIGANAGFHPNHNLILSDRGDMTMISSIVDDNRISALAVFSGTDSYSWCWRSASGAVQGLGNTCTSLKSVDNVPVALASSNPDVVSYMKEKLVSGPIPAHAFAPVNFNEDVVITIHTVPENAFIFFSAAEGELPPQLVAPEGETITSPFTVKLKRDPRNFGFAAAAPEYDVRAVSFTPDVSEINMRIALLKTGADNISIRLFDTSEPDNIQEVMVEEDTLIEFKSLLHERRTALASCLRHMRTKTFSVHLNDESALVLPESPAADGAAPAQSCLEPIMAEIRTAQSNGAMPELNDYSDVRFDITVP